MTALRKPQPIIADDLRQLNARILITEHYLDELRRLRHDADHRLMLLTVRREILLSQAEHHHLHHLQEEGHARALEDALSAPGSLDERLATGMRIVQDGESAPAPDDDGGDCDPSAQERAADDALHAHLDATNGWDAVRSAGETPAPQIVPDEDFAEQIQAEATAEVNEALNAYARHERERAAIEEREAMEALHSDQTCDASGQA